MKVRYNNEYYRIVDSDIPKTFQEFTEILPEIVSPEPLPPKYHLRYRDPENFPVKLSNQRAYKGFLEAKSKSQGEIIVFVTTEEQDEECRNMNLAFDGQPIHGGLNQFQLLIPNSSIIKAKKEEADLLPGINSSHNAVILEEGIVSSKLENSEGNQNGRLVKENPGEEQLCKAPEPASSIIKALENEKFAALETNILSEGLSDRLEKMQKQEEFHEPEKKVAKRGRKPKSEMNNLKDEKRNKEKEIHTEGSKNREIMKENTSRGLQNASKAPIENKKISKVPEVYTKRGRGKSGDCEEYKNLKKIVKKNKHTRQYGVMYLIEKNQRPQNKNIEKLKQKWKDDFFIETSLDDSEFIVLKTVILGVRLRDDPKIADLKSNYTITDKKAETFMEELGEALGDKAENISDLTILLKNCYSLTRGGIGKIFQIISKYFKYVSTLNLDFSYDRYRLIFKSYRKLPCLLANDLDLYHLQEFNINLRFRPDLSADSIERLRFFMEERAKIEEILRVTGVVDADSIPRRTATCMFLIPPLKSHDFYNGWGPQKIEYWDCNQVANKIFHKDFRYGQRKEQKQIQRSEQMRD